MKLIPLSKGQVAKVDDDVFIQLSKFNWHANRHMISGLYQAKRNMPLAGGGFKQVLMHREIMGVIEDRSIEIDHINHDPLDNQRSNLRFATRSQNCANRRVGKNSTTGFKGVYKRRDNGKYHAFIGSRKERRYLGCFDTAEEAHQVRHALMVERYGEFAYEHMVKVLEGELVA